MRNGVPYGQSDLAREKALEQLSYCLMYGGTAVLVGVLVLPRGGGWISRGLFVDPSGFSFFLLL